MDTKASTPAPTYAGSTTEDMEINRAVEQARKGEVKSTPVFNSDTISSEYERARQFINRKG